MAEKRENLKYPRQAGPGGLTFLIALFTEGDRNNFRDIPLSHHINCRKAAGSAARKNLQETQGLLS
jgi:hypothetical protein